MIFELANSLCKYTKEILSFYHQMASKIKGNIQAYIKRQNEFVVTKHWMTHCSYCQSVSSWCNKHITSHHRDFALKMLLQAVTRCWITPGITRSLPYKNPTFASPYDRQYCPSHIAGATKVFTPSHTSFKARAPLFTLAIIIIPARV